MNDPARARAVLHAFRTDLEEAERGGCAEAWLIDRAGTLASDIRDIAGDDRFVTEAGALYERATRLRFVLRD